MAATRSVTGIEWYHVACESFTSTSLINSDTYFRSIHRICVHAGSPHTAQAAMSNTHQVRVGCGGIATIMTPALNSAQLKIDLSLNLRDGHDGDSGRISSFRLLSCLVHQ